MPDDVSHRLERLERLVDTLSRELAGVRAQLDRCRADAPATPSSRVDTLPIPRSTEIVTRRLRAASPSVREEPAPARTESSVSGRYRCLEPRDRNG